MDLAHFIHTVTTRPDDLRQYRVVQLIADSFPFFLLHALRQRTAYSLKSHTVDIQQEEMGALTARLTTLFLGASYQYWIIGHDNLSSKKAHLFVEFLQRYTGPHTLILITSKPYKIASKSVSIVLDDKRKGGGFSHLESLFDLKKKGWIKELPASVSINQACMLLYYTVLGGQAYRKSSWMARLVSTPPALFMLSQYFFAQEPQKFFAVWKEVEQLYTIPFWVSFWSDQLWRAFFYVNAMRVQKSSLAKQYTYRLPFSFIKKDWRLYKSGKEFIKAHARLYAADFLSKNGGSAFGLDVMYSKFFSEKY